MISLSGTIHTLDQLVEFASLGSYCEYDLFGIETSHYQLNTHIDMPSDAQRIQRIKHLFDSGFGEKILIAHDIHTKHRLVSECYFSIFIGSFTLLVIHFSCKINGTFFNHSREYLKIHVDFMFLLSRIYI